jgi:hypothetical protein
MLPKMPHRVKIRSRPAAGPDPVTGNDTLGPPTETVTKAFLSQQSAHLLSGQTELRAEQDTTISTWTLIYPAAVAIDPRDEVIDDATGRVFQVLGYPAGRRGLSTRVQWNAVALHLISDLQEA